MSTRLLFRAGFRTHTKPLARTFSSSRPSATHGSFRRYTTLGLVSGAAVTTSLVLLNRQDPLYADAEEQPQRTLPSPSLSSLLRSYVVYTMCSIPPLVDWSPTILSTCLSIPIVRNITEAFVRITFFDQFVGADTAEGAIPLLEQFRQENKGCLFAYSVEVDEAAAAGKEGKDVQPLHQQIIQEMIHSVDVAADFEDKHRIGKSLKGRRTWVAVKLTALVPNHHVLTKLSKYLVQNRSPIPVAFPGAPRPNDLAVLDDYPQSAHDILSSDDIAILKELRAGLEAICQRASERNVRIIIDAEHTWYQPAIDAFALSLMVKFNRLPTSGTQGTTSSVQPLVYNTFQAYLRRTPEYLRYSLQTAKQEGYVLGVKLVRGAYHPHESQTHHTPLSISPDELPPVWPVKSDTDDCYNLSARILLDAIAEDISRVPVKSSSGSWKSWLLSKPATPGQPVESVPTVGVLFGTHNWKSSKLILDGLVSRGMAQIDGQTAEGESVLKIGDEVTERVTLAQLYGMHDDLTEYIVHRTSTSLPFVIKYVPYGSLTEVMPYLSRRAIENKSVLGDGAATEERRRAWAGIKAKVYGA
ncbi:FAD-linked oxidoreductase-like protein [Irpex rosettiformis]|uniref:FAD-linked oxidoreductase-like protein n=1 Tax=Irpex rosettiformis TaxID=378272 RepID=A0ACB8U6N6_9APHY|nr:FAD-linked oxidoreductase-like protein [Irpex rosettiformis]